MTVSREMPRYVCHKIVWALKIAAIEFEEDGSGKIAPKDEGYGSVALGAGWRSKFKGDEGDLGYYVVYADGYTSWSPSKAFEDGYAPDVR